MSEVTDVVSCAGKVPFLVHPLCREQMTDADDVGHLRADLEKEFPEFDWTLLPHDQFWWYIPAEQRIAEEKDLEAFQRR